MSLPAIRTCVTDRALGESNEQTIKTKLQTFLNCELRKTDDPFATLDFSNEDETVWAEAKRRFITHDRYPTVVIGKNKVDFLRAHGGNGVFCWTYNDGDYYIRYDPAVFDTFRVAPFQRLDRGGDAESLVYHVPITSLTAL
jgi:hypothetical protein